MFKKFLVMSPILFLMSCASLTEEACRTGNWESIGYKDGANGRSESYINEHRDACDDFGIYPDTARWLRGRIEGLRQYCTVENAYSIGRRGDELNNVCPQTQVSDLRLANFYGIRYYEIRQEIEVLEDEITDIWRILATDFTGELTPEQLSLKISYLSRIIKLQRQIQRLERELSKYDSLP